MNHKVVEAKIVREMANQIWNSREPIIDLEVQCERFILTLKKGRYGYV